MHDSRPDGGSPIVAGVRTPFAKSGTVLRDVTAVALARHATRELLLRTELDGTRGRRSHLRPGDPLGAGAERRARGEPPAAVSPQCSRLHPQSRLRLRGSGHRQRRRPDRARSCRRDHGGRGRITLRHSDPPLAALQPDPGRGEQGEDPGRSGSAILRQGAAARPRPGHPGDRRAVDRRDRWGSRRRRWRRRTASPARSRTGSRC